MKVFIMDTDGWGTGIDLAIRALNASHEVRYWSWREGWYGEGLVERPTKWEPEMEWADLIILIGNAKFGEELAPYFGKGYPIFGTNAKAAELELNREIGQKVLKDHGIKTIPFTVIESADEGISLIEKTGKAYAMKPWGGTDDKALTHIAKSPSDGIFTLEKWKKEGLLKGSLMMQEKVEGVEIGISGFFGPGGWSAVLEESFEHKKFMNDDLGCNTGEMGTVIRHVKSSKLFDLILEPLTDYLHSINYVGDCSVNCIVDRKGTAWPLEFTMRLGWPDFCIRQSLISGDPVEWMREMLGGQDTLKVSPHIATGVLMVHGNFPSSEDESRLWSGYPIYGITDDNYGSLHFQEVMEGKSSLLTGGKVKQVRMMQTAGDYVMIVSGVGKTVKESSEAAYKVAWEITWPSNVMFRTDIGKRLEKDLPALQKHGFAEGLTYG